ncbi:MAG: serine/threonine-protein kinase [Deltaproteobacteria bacterium]
MEPIAGGGMGFVYAAYDPELDRKVALKVVHPRRSHNPGSHSRLIKEARALAQLDHPNVVKVHDVFSDEDQIVVVMELVNGKTLEQWEAERPRTWREVVEVYVQAGEGLAAAHELAIVHRDFKPANAIIGADGRVRVLDFGLARITKEDVGDSPTEAMSGAITKTIPGTIMGTLAYAAPEQLSGGDTTTSSDQFSFCAALHYAIEGKRPFAGETAREIASAIQQGHPARSGRPLPNWLRALVARGLAATREERYPSMSALLLELERPRGWRRWRSRAFVAGSVCIAAFGASAALRQPAHADSCVANASDVWAPVQLVRILASLDHPAIPFADELAHKAATELDAKAREWTVVARDSCMAHHAAAVSDPMYDRQVACLAERKAQLGAAVQVLTSGTTATHATEVVSGVQSASDCLDLTHVLAVEQIPPTVRARVGAVRGQLRVGAALTRAGRFDEAQKIFDQTLADARATRYAPVLAEAQLGLGRFYVAALDNPHAGPVLREATSTALANNLTGIAVEAIGRRIYVESLLSPDRQFERDVELADPLSRAVGEPRVRALFLNNVGAAYSALGETESARTRYREAAATISSSETDIELSTIAYNLGLMAAEPSERVRLLDTVADQRAAILGVHHPFTLEARFAAATLGDEEVARQRLPAICGDYGAYRTTMAMMFSECERRLAFLAEHAGDETRHIEALRAAVSPIGLWGPVPVLLEGELALAEHSIDRARQLLTRAIAESTTSWALVDRADGHYYLAELALSTGDHAAAAEHARIALEDYRTLTKTDLSFEAPIRVLQAEQLLQGATER